LKAVWKAQSGKRKKRREKSFVGRMEGVVIDRVGVGIQERFVDFLSTYIDYGGVGGAGGKSYSRQVDQMVERESTTLFVDFQHLLEYDIDLAEQIEDEYYRFVHSQTLPRSSLTERR
jgi:hypothetical protein